MWDDLVWLLNYAATRPSNSITYIASDMCFHAHIDASYISTPKACSRAEGHFFFGYKPIQQNSPEDTSLNGTIHVVYKIIKNVLGSAAEAEIGTCYINAHELLPIRVCAEEMGHPKPPTLLQVDNTTSLGFANKNIKQEMTKAIDMRLYWIQDRKDQGQFTIYWSPVKTTLLVITENTILLLITH